MNAKLQESTTVEVKGRKARIRLMSAGAGSSGYYPPEMLESYGPATFPRGTHLFWDHLTENESWDRNGSHSIKDLIGVTESDAEYVADEQALYADALFYSSSADFIAEAMEDIGLSVEVQNYQMDPERIITEMGPHPYNAISVVPRAGRDGKVTALLESFRENKTHGISESGNIKDIGSNNRKDEGMTPEDIKAIVEGIKEAFAPSFNELKEALAPASVEAPPVEPAVEAVDVAAITESLIEADLPKAARERVLAQVNSEGVDVAKLIESEKAYIDQLRESAQPGTGRIQESASKADEDYSVSGWGN